MKVFGIGVHKTGTTTLAECLRVLGYDMCPESAGYEIRVDVAHGDDVRCIPLAMRCQAFVDSPWNFPGIYQLMSREFPVSKFILTTRDPEMWYESLLRWVTDGEGQADGIDMQATLGTVVSRESAYDNILAFQRHQSDAIEYFDAIGRSDDLLVVDWASGDGWQEVCRFLGRTVPPVTFPHMLRFDSQLNGYTNKPAAPEKEPSND